MARATVQFECETTMCAGELAAAVHHALSLGGLPGRIGYVGVSIAHEGEPSPENGRRMWFSPALGSVVVMEHGPTKFGEEQS